MEGAAGRGGRSRRRGRGRRGSRGDAQRRHERCGRCDGTARGDCDGGCGVCSALLRRCGSRTRSALQKSAPHDSMAAAARGRVAGLRAVRGCGASAEVIAADRWSLSLRFAVSCSCAVCLRLHLRCEAAARTVSAPHHTHAHRGHSEHTPLRSRIHTQALKHGAALPSYPCTSHSARPLGSRLLPQLAARSLSHRLRRR